MDPLNPRDSACDADEAMLLGIQQRRAGRFAEAEALFEALLREQPGRADALHQLGLTRSEQAAYASAIELLSAAVARALWRHLGAELGVVAPEASSASLRRWAAHDTPRRGEQQCQHKSMTYQPTPAPLLGSRTVTLCTENKRTPGRTVTGRRCVCSVHSAEERLKFA